MPTYNNRLSHTYTYINVTMCVCVCMHVRVCISACALYLRQTSLDLDKGTPKGDIILLNSHCRICTRMHALKHIHTHAHICACPCAHAHICIQCNNFYGYIISTT